MTNRKISVSRACRIGASGVPCARRSRRQRARGRRWQWRRQQRRQRRRQWQCWRLAWQKRRFARQVVVSPGTGGQVGNGHHGRYDCGLVRAQGEEHQRQAWSAELAAAQLQRLYELEEQEIRRHSGLCDAVRESQGRAGYGGRRPSPTGYAESATDRALQADSTANAASGSRLCKIRSPLSKPLSMLTTRRLPQRPSAQTRHRSMQR